MNKKCINLFYNNYKYHIKLGRCISIKLQSKRMTLIKNNHYRQNGKRLQRCSFSNNNCCSSSGVIFVSERIDRVDRFKTVCPRRRSRIDEKVHRRPRTYRRIRSTV